MTLNKSSLLLKDIGNGYIMTGENRFHESTNIDLDKPLFIDGSIQVFGLLESNVDLHCIQGVKADSIIIDGNFHCDSVTCDSLTANHVVIVSSCYLFDIEAIQLTVLGTADICGSVKAHDTYTGDMFTARNIYGRTLNIPGLISLCGVCEIGSVIYNNEEMSFVENKADSTKSETVLSSYVFTTTKNGTTVKKAA